jgi:hypothetical protein
MDQNIIKQDIDSLKQELLEKLASKEELNKVEKRLDDRLDEVEKRLDGRLDKAEKTDHILAKAIVDIQERMKQLETKEDADRKFKLIMNAIDGLAKKIDDYKVEKVAHDYSLRQHDKQLENHEKRITALETSLN